MVPFVKILLVVTHVYVPMATLLMTHKSAKISTNVKLVPRDVLKAVPTCQVLSNVAAVTDTPTMLIPTHAMTLMSVTLLFATAMHNVQLINVESETDVTT